MKVCTIQEATQIGCKEKLVEFIEQLNEKHHVFVWMSLGFAAYILVQVTMFI